MSDMSQCKFTVWLLPENSSPPNETFLFCQNVKERSAHTEMVYTSLSPAVKDGASAASYTTQQILNSAS